MRLIRILIIVSLSLLACANRAVAQNSLLDVKDLSNVNIDNYSDNDLAGFYQKAVSSGLSQDQLYNLLTERGLPSTEINKLKERLQSVAGLSKKSAIDTAESPANETAHLYDTAGKSPPIQRFKPDESIFGSELFTSNSLVFEPNLRIPAPAGYVLGPDDELVISVYGYSEKQYHLSINEEGEIYIPNVGPIVVNGLSIEQARDKIKSKLASTIYKAINTGKT